MWGKDAVLRQSSLMGSQRFQVGENEECRESLVGHECPDLTDGRQHVNSSCCLSMCITHILLSYKHLRSSRAWTGQVCSKQWRVHIQHRDEKFDFEPTVSSSIVSNGHWVALYPECQFLSSFFFFFFFFFVATKTQHVLFVKSPPHKHYVQTSSYHKRICRGYIATC